MAVNNLVTLEIQFAAGADDESARLCWVSDAGAEQEYAVVLVRATVTQETFPGHSWILRGRQTGNVLWRCVAAATPPVQVHTVRVRPGQPAGGQEAGEADDGEAAEVDEGDAATPAAGDDEPAADSAGAAGLWLDAAGLHRFERLPRAGRDGQVLWRQLDSAGRETARLEQLEARVDTRWLWWTRAILARVAPQMTGEREQMIWCALTIAAAYRLDASDFIPWPAAWRHAAARVGPQPMALLCALFLLVMCSIAAALPLRDTSLLLYNATERNEIRLSDTHGYSRQPSNRPGYVNPWAPVCAGGFRVVPADVREKQGQRGFHAAFVLGAAAAVVSGAMRVLQPRPPTSVEEMLAQEYLKLAAEGDV